MLKKIEKVEELFKRERLEANPQIEKAVREIIQQVKKTGDRALKELTLKYDQVELKVIRVPQDAIQAAHRGSDKQFLAALSQARNNIENFHRQQEPEEFFEQVEAEAIRGMRVIPLDSVGIYVPGGRASYPSSVLMTAIPAKVAGVKKIVMVSPPPISPYILAAAAEVGVNEVYQIGGAQAIAALAYGTESIPQVDKIVGPGNAYVTMAKRLVFGIVGIDSLAGPSDITIIADSDSDPSFIAADILAQAEHDPEASAILITDSDALADKVNDEITKQLNKVQRKEIIKQALKDNSLMVIVKDLKEAVELTNRLAPEHLEILASCPQKILEKIRNAGAVFMGPYSPVAAGDYVAGPNHVLPTGGGSRFSSPLSVYDFIKRQSVLAYTKPALEKIRQAGEILAEIEGLDAHARSIAIRFS